MWQRANCSLTKKVMCRWAIVVSLVTSGLSDAALVEAEKVLDLKCPPPSISSLRVVRDLYWPRFVGDVNGDGCDDFMITCFVENGSSVGC